MSLVVICKGSLSMVETCSDALAKVVLDHPEYATTLAQFKQKARELVKKSAAKAIKKLEARGIKSRGYVEDETHFQYTCRGGHRQPNAPGGSLDADFCLYTDAFHHGMGIKVDAKGTVTFNTVRHSGTYSVEQLAEMDRMRKVFSAALITEFFQAALAMVCTQVTAEVMEHNGHRVVHLQGIKS